jgi:hypothetical protein
MRLPLFRTTLSSCFFLILLNANPSLAQHAQGEVKFSPGTKGKPALLADDWRPAETGLTIEQGYTLATENGRAIVEFENGSMVYLDEHSVLQFQKMQISDNGSTTNLTLLTGTATIAHVSQGQDQIAVTTPTNYFRSQGNIALRIDSLLNGTIVRPVDTTLEIKNTQPNLNPGETLADVDGYRFRLQPTELPAEDDWDKWVAAQRADRDANIKEGLAASGLGEPIPGLVDLVQNGHFFDCPPYGKCWEPNEESTEAQGTEVPQAQGQQPPSAPPGKIRPKQPPVPFDVTLLTRCPILAWRYNLLRMDPFSKLDQTLAMESFPWSGCFTGRWYFRNHRPVYVIGHRHHHPHHPCWTVHTAHGLSIIPRSPLDRKGQPPANAKYGTFVLARDKNGVHGSFDPAPPSGNQHWQTSVPKSFAQERALMVGIPKVSAPVIQGRMVTMAGGAANVAKAIQAASRPENVVPYDYQSKNFVAPRDSRFPGASQSGAGPVVVAHVGSHGVSSGPTAHGGAGFGGSSGGGHAGGASSSGSGGGGHSGGGSSGGAGGGGHAGGGSSSGGGGGASTGSAGGGSAAGGGSHH